ncbi:MAG TPA: nitronate monooxygenase, partial [Bacteroidia bacterium]|nr:nitronate monooxygenase [Bacteroidia bacterium]
EAVQVGSRFVASMESSAHINFKNAIISTPEGGTQLTLKQLTPVRLIRNKFFKEVDEAEKRGASVEEIKTLLGRARAKKGMFEGDLEEGELEIGQVSNDLKEIKPASRIVDEMMSEFIATLNKLKNIS